MHIENSGGHYYTLGEHLHFKLLVLLRAKIEELIESVSDSHIPVECWRGPGQNLKKFE